MGVSYSGRYNIAIAFAAKATPLASLFAHDCIRNQDMSRLDTPSLESFRVHVEWNG
jgi:hypothetical protein